MNNYPLNKQTKKQWRAGNQWRAAVRCRSNYGKWLPFHDQIAVGGDKKVTERNF